MLVLAIECSSPQGSVALVEGGRVLANQEWSFASLSTGESHQHSELLIPSIRKGLQFASRKLSDVNLVAVGNGPGRFTGIRVAVNAAKSIAYSLNKPLMSFSSLEILAASVTPGEKDAIAIANAHKNSIYLQEFRNLGGRYRPKSGPVVMTVSAFEEFVLDPIICVGDGYPAYEDLFSTKLRKKLIRPRGASDFPRASTLGEIANLDFDPVTTLDWESIQPLYIRASEAEEKLKAGSLQEVRAPNWKE